jgi:hypothetical protein
VEGFGGKVYRSPEAANLSIAFQAGAKHILELVESEGVLKVAEIICNEVNAEIDYDIGQDCLMPHDFIDEAKAAQKAIADEIRKEIK